MDTPHRADNEKFGLSVALATPFRADLSVNIPKLVEHARWCLANGCDSVTALGSTGEGPSISFQECADLLAEFASAGIAGDRLVVGIFATDIHSAVATIREAYSVGASKILIAPPFYFKDVNDAGVLSWYISVFDELGADWPDAILYNLPSQTGVTISPELVSSLRDRYGSRIAGIKDSSSNLSSTHKFLDTHGDIAVLVGDERHLGEAMAHGAQGSICGMANLQPALMQQVIELARTDADIDALVDELCRYPLFPAIKFALSLQHNDADWEQIRPPFLRMNDTERSSLRQWYLDRFSQN